MINFLINGFSHTNLFSIQISFRYQSAIQAKAVGLKNKSHGKKSTLLQQPAFDRLAQYTSVQLIFIFRVTFLNITSLGTFQQSNSHLTKMVQYCQIFLYGTCPVIEGLINYFVIHTAPTSAVCEDSCVTSYLRQKSLKQTRMLCEHAHYYRRLLKKLRRRGQ